MRAVFDTCILIDYLKGVDAAKAELRRFEGPQISLLTWMEVLVGTTNPQEESLLRRFLGDFEVVELTKNIAEAAVRIRRSSRIRLPDAVIWATAKDRSSLLVTRNTRDFPTDDPGVRIPYEL